MLHKLLVSLLLFSPLCLGAKITKRYDPYIKEACSLYLPDIDCDWFKALLYAESRLDPSVSSHVGARGIAQIMPGTWDENAPRIGEELNTPYEARASIRVGAFYLSRMIKFWDNRRPDIQRLFLAIPSYNAGPGNVLRAQRKCGGARTWTTIKPCLHKVTGKHSKETLDYVVRIKSIYCRLKADEGRGVWAIQSFSDNCLNLFLMAE